MDYEENMLKISNLKKLKDKNYCQLIYDIYMKLVNTKYM